MSQGRKWIYIRLFSFSHKVSYKLFRAWFISELWAPLVTRLHRTPLNLSFLSWRQRQMNKEGQWPPHIQMGLSIHWSMQWQGNNMEQMRFFLLPGLCGNSHGYIHSEEYPENKRNFCISRWIFWFPAPCIFRKEQLLNSNCKSSLETLKRNFPSCISIQRNKWWL